MVFDGASVSLFVKGFQAVISMSMDSKEMSIKHVIKIDLPRLKKEEVEVQLQDV